ncbi:hypothetical protein COB55_01670 [Candidatus Wolfebacteria bacterium]|nr:MAG: hypothetical protein COB55_01670 [Candidatus Wolfebacteria bacterium]
MATNVEVTKNSSENNVNLIRRFSKRVRGAGILNRVRSLRFYERAKSPGMRKKKTLTRLVRQAKTRILIKLGKINPDERRNKRR